MLRERIMVNSSLCYIERDGAYLMLHRTKKKNDENSGKWIGVGGRFEEGESPDECAAREIFEETGLTVRSLRLCGVVTFVSDEWGTEHMHLFTSDDFDGDVSECDEGDLAWIDKDEVMNLNLWEGDRIFLELLMRGDPFFLLKLEYSGDRLTSAALNGEEIDIGRLP